MRRAFDLPESDREYLGSCGRAWESICDGGSQWLLLHEYPVVTGYNHVTATSALLLAPGYPETQIDMVYFFPHLARADGKSIPSLSEQQIDGKGFQRWSRHRTSDGPWRAGVDCVGTHLLLVDEWLRREFRVR